MKNSRAIALLLITLAASPSAVAQQEARTFENPMVRGILLDYCRNWGENCGTPAANLWCLEQGFERAGAWQIRRGAGKTVVFGDGRLCEGAHCDGFARIECLRGEPQSMPSTAAAIAYRPTVSSLSATQRSELASIADELRANPESPRAIQAWRAYIETHAPNASDDEIANLVSLVVADARAAAADTWDQRSAGDVDLQDTSQTYQMSQQQAAAIQQRLDENARSVVTKMGD